MKILKYVLFAVLALVVLFFAVGIFTPVVNYGTEITANKPLQEAWAVTQDESKYDQWLEGFKSMELIEGEKGQPGSKHKVIVEPSDGQPEFEMIETLVALEEFKYVDMHFDSETMDFEQKIFYNESEGKTTIRSESKVIAKNIVTRSLFALMEKLGGAFTAQEKKNFEALKKLIEENTTDYYPAPAVSEAEEAATMEDSE